MTISKDEVERARLMSEYQYAVDTQREVVHARREGWQEGRKEGQREIIDLLKSGKSAEEIIRDYGITK